MTPRRARKNCARPFRAISGGPAACAARWSRSSSSTARSRGSTFAPGFCSNPARASSSRIPAMAWRGRSSPRRGASRSRSRPIRTGSGPTGSPHFPPGSPMSRPRTNIRSAGSCRSPAGSNCSPGLAAAAPVSSRMITTASTATTSPRSRLCTRSPRAMRSSISAPSQRRSRRRSGSAISSCRRPSPPSSPPPRRWPIVTRPGSSSRR